MCYACPNNKQEGAQCSHANAHGSSHVHDLRPPVADRLQFLRVNPIDFLQMVSIRARKNESILAPRKSLPSKQACSAGCSGQNDQPLALDSRKSLKALSLAWFFIEVG